MQESQPSFSDPVDSLLTVGLLYVRLHRAIGADQAGFLLSYFANSKQRNLAKSKAGDKSSMSKPNLSVAVEPFNGTSVVYEPVAPKDTNSGGLALLCLELSVTNHESSTV